MKPVKQQGVYDDNMRQSILKKPRARTASRREIREKRVNINVNFDDD